MKKAMAVCLALMPFAMAAPIKAQRVLTWCAADGNQFGLKDYPDSAFVAYVGNRGDELRGRYLDAQSSDALFTLVRNGRVLDHFRIKGLNNPNGWIARSEDGERFALTWSNAGATGGWTTQVFHFSPAGKFIEDATVQHLFERNFSAHHNCRNRGNNYLAVRWLDADRLLISAEVYPTSDCGEQMGFTEGYIVNLKTSLIEQRLSETEVMELPQVCTQTYNH